MLRAQFPNLSVLVVSGFPEEHRALALIRRGAAGYVGKDTAPREFIEAIRAEGIGQRHWTGDVAPLLVIHLAEQRPLQLHDALPTRKLQDFLRLARGETGGAMGRNLALSHKIMSTYRSSLMRKLALDSNRDLTHYAVKHGQI